MLKPSNVHDTQVFKDIFNQVNKRYKGLIEAAGLDAGYKTGPIIKALTDEQILPLMPYKRTNAKKGDFGNHKFIYDQDIDSYTCPNYETLVYKNTTRQGYKEYRCDERICKACQFKKQCMSPKSKVRVLRVSVYKSYFEYAYEIRISPYGKETYALRKQTIERCFGDYKERHDGRFTYYRGLKKVSEHVSLAFACMNVKKMALRLGERALKASAQVCLYLNMTKNGLNSINKKPLLNLKLALSF